MFLIRKPVKILFSTNTTIRNIEKIIQVKKNTFSFNSTIPYTYLCVLYFVLY